jgi:hypothetical protein
LIAASTKTAESGLEPLHVIGATSCATREHERASSMDEAEVEPRYQVSSRCAA